jgi:hypothetical protein
MLNTIFLRLARLPRKKTSRLWASFSALLLNAGISLAQDTTFTGNFPPPAIPLKIHATETKNGINIDGRLNELDWQKATPVSDFFRIEPRQGGNYSSKTEVRILFDKKNLYFGVFCSDKTCAAILLLAKMIFFFCNLIHKT